MTICLRCLLFCAVGLLLTDSLRAEDVLFEDRFDGELSDRWEAVGLERGDYRVRDGALELRVRPHRPGQSRPMLKVNLPFTTKGIAIASVDVLTPEPLLKRGEQAGLCLTSQDHSVFSVRKTNIDGYFMLAPGQAQFVGKPGDEGDSRNYAVKYWPARDTAGLLRIIVRGDYAHFQVGPSDEGEFLNLFHSAISPASEGLGFGLFATGDDEQERWVRFKGFRVTR